MANKLASTDLPTEMIDRDSDVAYVMARIAEAECCSLVGLSNVGKSVLLRSLPLPAVHEQYLSAGRTSGYMFVYVDFNLTSQMSEQGFYEVILRNILESIDLRNGKDKLHAAVAGAYEKVIAPNSPFLIPLAFEDALESITEQYQGTWVLLFDEFDEVFSEIDARVFVRLRALKDRYGDQLCYVTATGHPLSDIRREREVGEFCELFTAHTHYLTALDEAASRELVRRWTVESEIAFSDEDVEFVLHCAGGHPALLQATRRVLAKAKEEAIWRPASGQYERVREQLDSDANVRLECAKLWNDLNTQERETLVLLLGSQDVTSGLDLLAQKGIVRPAGTGRATSQEAGEARVFSDLFAGFAKRQQLMRLHGPRGIRVDVDSGDVWVDGEPAPMLTELEYKLLLLLYGNLDKICDKYKIVESVWGESYIDEVDDARIEKLVSRLRQKIEPFPDEPRYLMTVRGRGYKLAGPD
jgi:hypothetical protein